jgi:hypothetical protein
VTTCYFWERANSILIFAKNVDENLGINLNNLVSRGTAVLSPLRTREMMGGGRGGGNLTPKNAKHPPLNINIVSSASRVGKGGDMNVSSAVLTEKNSKLRPRTSKIYNSIKN